MENRSKKTVPLGSGRFYISEFSGSMPDAVALVALCTAESQFGETKGGATLTYSATEHKEQDEIGRAHV